MKKMSNSIKNPDTYKALRKEGESKSKSARIANAQASSDINHHGRKALPYEQRTKSELYSQAKNLNIEGRSLMNKEALIRAIRNS